MVFTAFVQVLGSWPYLVSASNFLFSLTVLHNYREKGEGDSDVQDLVLSFAALEEKVLEQYTYAKV